MDTTTQGAAASGAAFAPTRLTYETRGPAPAEAKGVIVVLHGVGGNPAKAWQLFEHAVPQGVMAVLCRGPFPWPQDPAGAGWFGVKFNDDGTREVKFDEEVESRAALVELVEVVRADPRLKGKRIVLLGFHQGAIMSVNALLQRPDLLDGVALVTARVMAEVAQANPPQRAHRGLPVIWAHADADYALPLPLAVAGRPILADYGCDVTEYDYPGGAEVPPETAARLRVWLEQLFNL